MATLGQLPIDLSKSQNFYCKLKIGTAEIPPHAINSLVVREWIFDIIPRLELTLQDDGTLFEVFNLKDGTEIEVDIAKTPEKGEHLRTTFILDNYTVDSLVGNGTYIFTINAMLKVNNLFFPIHTRAFKNKTSIDVLKQIGSEIGLNSKTFNNLRASDKMTWYQINSYNFDMIKHIVSRSNIIGDCLIPYIDTYGNFNITSIKKESEKSNNKIARYNVQNATNDTFENKVDESIIWFNGYKVDNLEGYYNKTIGYGLEYNYYDLKGLKYDTIDKSYQPFTINSGQGSNSKQYVDSVNLGILTDNTFKDYFKAQLNNKYLRETFFSQRVAISINSLADVKLMDKITITLPSLLKKDQINSIYSGDYLCAGIVYKVQRGGIFMKEISVHRGGYNDSSFKT